MSTSAPGPPDPGLGLWCLSITLGRTINDGRFVLRVVSAGRYAQVFGVDAGIRGYRSFGPHLQVLELVGQGPQAGLPATQVLERLADQGLDLVAAECCDAGLGGGEHAGSRLAQEGVEAHSQHRLLCLVAKHQVHQQRHRLAQARAEQARAIGYEPERVVAAAVGAEADPRPIEDISTTEVAAAALRALAEKQSTWRAAEVVRELAAAVPPSLTAEPGRLMGWLDELAADVIDSHMVELAPPVPEGMALRRDDAYAASRRAAQEATHVLEATLWRDHGIERQGPELSL